MKKMAIVAAVALLIGVSAADMELPGAITVPAVCAAQAQKASLYEKAPAVKCINGTFIGKQEGNISMYLGVPFVAKQPVGEYRWKAPVPFTQDNGVYEATEYGKAPCQVIIPGDPNSSQGAQGEDCLYLNVFKNSADRSGKKPVMVWIHGGAFECGAAAQPCYEGQYFVRDNPDVILVTIEYRVGLFGFLHLSHLKGGEEYPDAGNLGMLDQAMALKWVHDNIAAFGGDPDNVTIFGQSAGGCAVSLLPLMEEARPYFKRVIAESGSPALTRTTEDSLALTEKIMKKCGCTTIEELKKLPASALIGATEEFVHWPELDGRIIPLNPYEDYRAGKCKGFDMMGGYVKDEMRQFVASYGGYDNFYNFFGTIFNNSQKKYSPHDIKNTNDFLREQAQIGGKGYAMEQLYNQKMVMAPQNTLLDYHASAGGRTYYYFWTQECRTVKELAEKGVDLSKLDIFGAADENAIELKACHGVEVCTVFNNREPEQATDIFDLDFSRTVQRMWVNFAKCGDPTVPAAESPTGKAIVWPQYTKENGKVMVLNEKGTEVKTDVVEKVVDKRFYIFYKYWNGITS